MQRMAKAPLALQTKKVSTCYYYHQGNHYTNGILDLEHDS